MRGTTHWLCLTPDISEDHMERGMRFLPVIGTSDGRPDSKKLTHRNTPAFARAHPIKEFKIIINNDREFCYKKCIRVSSSSADKVPLVCVVPDRCLYQVSGDTTSHAIALKVIHPIPKGIDLENLPSYYTL